MFYHISAQKIVNAAFQQPEMYRYKLLKTRRVKRLSPESGEVFHQFSVIREFILDFVNLFYPKLIAF